MFRFKSQRTIFAVCAAVAVLMLVVPPVGTLEPAGNLSHLHYGLYGETPATHVDSVRLFFQLAVLSAIGGALLRSAR